MPSCCAFADIVGQHQISPGNLRNRKLTRYQTTKFQTGPN